MPNGFSCATGLGPLALQREIGEIRDLFEAIVPVHLVMRLPLMSRPRVVDMVPTCRDRELRFEWRGNRVHVAFSDLEMQADPDRMIRWLLEQAMPVGRLPCRHVEEKRRRLREPEFPAHISELGPSLSTAALHSYVRCEDCGADLG
jgi:hypothetical protein